MRPFLSIAALPVHCNVLCDTRDAAMAVPKGDLELAVCGNCGHIFNQAFDPMRMAYSVEYENSLHFSGTFQDFSQGLARHLVERYAVRGGRVVDVGCGKGDFLANVCEIGGSQGWGFDLSYSPDAATHPEVAGVQFIRDLYSKEYAYIEPDLLCCRHVLEHIETPRRFLADVSAAIERSANPVIYFEVPNALFTLRDLGIWDLIYEHCSYFTSVSLTELFATSGFEILDLREVYHGQFLAIECRRGQSKIGGHAGEVQAIGELADVFAERFHEKVEDWRARLEGMRAGGKRAVVWGGGSKGVTFLNLFPSAGIDHVVDINPRKQGKFVPGGGQEIVGPGQLQEIAPDVVILMNPVYTREVRSALAELGLAPEICSPTPSS
jgi:SAM-dependent methyltransferase